MFFENRVALLKLLPDRALVVLTSNDEMPRSGDQNFKYKQNVNLWYLTGISQESSTLVLLKIGNDCRELLFIREPNVHLQTWEGYKYSKKEAEEISGIKEVYWETEFYTVLSALFLQVEEVFLDIKEGERVAYSELYTKEIRLLKEFKNRYPLHQYRRLYPYIAGLRTIKSTEEIELMTSACGITRDAFLRVLSMVRPNVYEYEIEAEIIYEFIRKGADGPAFASIVASGSNACVLHYTSNKALCRDGDMVLIDFGAEYGNYNADVTRVVPVGGKFTVRQMEVYKAVLRIQQNAQQMLVSSTNFDDYHKSVINFVEFELVALGLIDRHDLAKQDKKQPIFRKYFMHGISHFLGLDVHDVGDKAGKIPVGSVLTCEPGIYIQEEGMGIRLENDILITEKGNVNLTASIPIELEEIEYLINTLKVKS